MPHPELSQEQRRWCRAALAEVDVARLRELNKQVTDIHSPTGRERAAAEFLAAYLREIGLQARFQPMGATSGAAVGRLHGASAAGTSLLLYSPIDTHLEGSDEDVPWVGERLRDDMVPRATQRGDAVIGLGAANPKGMVATLAEAARAVRAVGAPLAGDLIVAFAGGGMPVDLGAAGNRGLSDGVAHLLARGVCADYAVVLKPGNFVYHEEPGLCWFKIAVKGSLGYAGMAHDLPTIRSSIAPAARLILELENWLPAYTERNTSGQVAPQGWISCLRAGWPERVAFPSATTEIYLDIRCNPRTPPAEVRSQFAEAMAEIKSRQADLDFSWDMIASLPGASTNPESWIVKSSIRAWEEVEERPHPEPRRTSGQTDISMIRNLGIPTARTGWASAAPKTPADLQDGLGGMGVSFAADLVVACRKLVYTIIDTCMRTRDATGAVRQA